MRFGIVGKICRVDAVHLVGIMRYVVLMIGGLASPRYRSSSCSVEVLHRVQADDGCCHQ